jgi:hypothetical protein
MQLIEVHKRDADVRLTKGEVMILNNALYEVCNGTDLAGFATQVEASVSEVRQLLEEVNDLLHHYLLGQTPLP